VETANQKLFRIQEFARLAGVTVRALHHYDRLELLRPKQRSAAGHRLYGLRDLARLEQIVVLKFLGVPLKQARGLLEHESQLAQTLRKQQAVLLEKRRQMDTAVRAIGNALRALESEKKADWKLFQLIVRELEMQNRIEWKGKYFSEDAKLRVAERRKQLGTEAQKRADQDWAALYAEAESLLPGDPAGARAQKLAERWCALVEEFTGGDPEIRKGLEAMWEDRKNWPENVKRGAFAKPEVQEFVHKAVRERKRRSPAVVLGAG